MLSTFVKWSVRRLLCFVLSYFLFALLTVPLFSLLVILATRPLCPYGSPHLYPRLDKSSSVSSRFLLSLCSIFRISPSSFSHLCSYCFLIYSPLHVLLLLVLTIDSFLHTPVPLPMPCWMVSFASVSVVQEGSETSVASSSCMQRVHTARSR